MKTKTFCKCGNPSTARPHTSTYTKKDGTKQVYHTVDKRCDSCRASQKLKADRNRKRYANTDHFIFNCF